MTKTLTEQQIRKIIENVTGKAAKVCEKKFYGKLKSLTEQWREGKLPENTYYVQFICGRYGVYEFEQYKGFGFDNDFAYIKEVVATVPSYEQYKELTQRVGRLELDNEVLEDVVQECNKRGLENKKLQEQLKEANELLKTAGYGSKENIYKLPYVCPEECRNYLKKWGVK